MVAVGELVNHWGYLAIFGIVILGNLGVPLPEEGVLLLAGYLVWAGKLRSIPVLFVGILSAIIGDNVGYYFGHHFGQQAIRRYGHIIFITPNRLNRAAQFVHRYGPDAVFVARFLPGLRFLAGPLAGSAGLPFMRFFTANVAGGLVYVPVIVGAGYFLGHILGDEIQQIELIAGKIEHYALAFLAVTAIVLFLSRAYSARKASKKSGGN